MSNWCDPSCSAHLLTSDFISIKSADVSEAPVLELQICWGTSHPDIVQFPSKLYCRLGRFTYVHQQKIFSLLASYLTAILPPNRDTEPPTNLPDFRHTQINLELVTPALFFPDPSSLHVLVVRTASIKLTNSSLSARYGDSETRSGLIFRTHWKEAECLHVNLTQLAPIRSTVDNEQISWFYTHWDNLRDYVGSGIDSVLEPTSGTFWVRVFIFSYFFSFIHIKSCENVM